MQRCFLGEGCRANFNSNPTTKTADEYKKEPVCWILLMKTAFDIQKLETKKQKKDSASKYTHTKPSSKSHKTTCTSCKHHFHVLRRHKHDVHRMMHIVCECTLVICQSSLSVGDVFWGRGLFHGPAEDWTSGVWFTRHPEGCRCGWPALASCLTGFYPSRCRCPSSPFQPPGVRLPDRIGTPDPSAGCPTSVSRQPADRETENI